MVDEGKGRPDPSRDKNVGKHRRRKVGHKRIQEEEKAPVFTPSCVTSVGSSWTEKYTEQVESSRTLQRVAHVSP